VATKTQPKYVRQTRRCYSKSGSSTTLTSTSTVTQRWNDTFTGIDNPSWRRDVQNGLNATTAANGSRQVLQLVVGTARADYQTELFPPPNPKYRDDASYVQGSLFLSIPDLIDPTALLSASADTQARLQFLSKYRSTRTAFQGGTFFGELAETVRMLRHPALALRRGIDSYYRAASGLEGSVLLLVERDPFL